MRLLRELAELRRDLAASRSLAVVGGGFIGGEVASAARARGLEVTLIEAMAAPLAAVLGVEVGERIAAQHRAHGVEVLTGAPIERITRDDGGFTVHVGGGASCVPTVVVGSGCVPRRGGSRGQASRSTAGS
ncbi:MAG: FAD-dependent oxidoreductase [Actinomycetota bacterium]|nr:FAD-dependent oxidoreductase [Actinomycetota bacterium]